MPLPVRKMAEHKHPNQTSTHQYTDKLPLASSHIAQEVLSPLVLGPEIVYPIYDTMSYGIWDIRLYVLPSPDRVRTSLPSRQDAMGVMER